MAIILGSQSPRRREILDYFSLPFIQVHSSFDEESVPFEGDPVRYARTLSEGKAEALLPRFPEEVILTADTVVFCQGKVYNKPRDEQEAFQTLQLLSGKEHQVFTSVTVRKGEVQYSEVEVTAIVFNPLLPEQIRAYLSHVSCLDKAGGYAIQGAGSLIVQKIEGCYYNVMGLPINAVERLLKKFGLDLWNFLKVDTCGR